MAQATEITIDTSRDVFIIGNGVIAKALAVALKSEGRKVTVLRGSLDDQPAYSEHIQVELTDSTLQADITISTLSNYHQLEGIVLLTNKSFGNKELAEKLRPKVKGSPIVFLQNGLHIEDSFLDLGFTELYRCVLFATSQAVSENKVRFRSVASSPIGVIRGSGENLHNIVQVLNTDIFPFSAEVNIQNFIWKKAISNCVFNSICPLLEADNGIFHRSDAALQVAKTVIGECLKVAKASGIELTMDDLLQNVLFISEKSDGQNISTYQDILNGRRTEIETLNFAIAKEAHAAHDIDVPVTAILGELIKIKSELSRRENG